MTLESVITLFQTHGWEIGILILIAGCIKIPTYEIRLLPYCLKKLARGFGNAINGDIMDHINTNIVSRIEKLEGNFTECSVGMRNELTNFIQRSEEERTDRARSRILRFSDEVSMEIAHSEEHYNEILEDIDKYEDYCDTHPGYENNKAIIAIQIIRESYAECKKNHNFLTYKNFK